MIKKLCCVALCMSASFAIDMKLSSDNSAKVSIEEINVLKEKYQHRKLIVENDTAKKEIQDYRVLANEYLKSGAVSPKALANIKIETEKMLAYEFIRVIQANTKINDEILLSYYSTHKDEFVADVMLELNILRTDSYKEAIEMYEAFKAGKIANVEKYASAHNIGIESKPSKFKEMNKIYQMMYQNQDKKENIMFAPRFYKDHYTIVHIDKYSASRQQSFEEAKAEIERKLKIETVEKTKKELLAKYAKEK